MSASTLSTGTPTSYGPLLVLLASLSAVPGIGSLTSPVVGLATLTLGLQLMAGRPFPWLPGWARQRMGASSLGGRFSAWLQERCRPLLHLRAPGFPGPLAGLTVAWSSLILMLPLAFIPFSNTIPSLSVGLVGAGLVAQRSLLGWLGFALAGSYTLVLALLGEALVLAAQALIRHLA
ncbi:MAG: exopolysaccharide biosynthesis protein [Holophagaceae bacterium]